MLYVVGFMMIFMLFGVAITATIEAEFKDGTSPIYDILDYYVKRGEEYRLMRKEMKRLKKNHYVDTDLPRKEMMIFNKRFWGGYKFVNPKLYRNRYTGFYVIKF